MRGSTGVPSLRSVASCCVNHSQLQLSPQPLPRLSSDAPAAPTSNSAWASARACTLSPPLLIPIILFSFFHPVIPSGLPSAAPTCHRLSTLCGRHVLSWLPISLLPSLSQVAPRQDPGVVTIRCVQVVDCLLSPFSTLALPCCSSCHLPQRPRPC